MKKYTNKILVVAGSLLLITTCGLLFTVSKTKKWEKAEDINIRYYKKASEGMIITYENGNTEFIKDTTVENLY